MPLSNRRLWRGTPRERGTGRAAAGLMAALRESPALWWSFLYFFCLLSGYYVLRPVRRWPPRRTWKRCSRRC
jgi:hypothetical protein